MFNNYCRRYNTFEIFDSWRAVISLYRFFKPIHTVPDPKGSLSLTVPPSVIHQANQEVISVIEKTPNKVMAGKESHIKRLAIHYEPRLVSMLWRTVTQQLRKNSAKNLTVL